MQMAEEILNVVAATPVIAGIEANDPRFWDLSYLIDKFMAEGYSGLISYPTIGFFRAGEPVAADERERRPGAVA